MARNIISMREDGRMTFPATARKALHIEGETDFAYEVTNGGLFLRPILTIPREDAWAYTPEESAAIERALRSPIVPGVTDEDLAIIAAADDPEQAARDLIARRLHA